MIDTDIEHARVRAMLRRVKVAVLRLARKEPAVLLGSAAALLAEAASVLEVADSPHWTSAVPVLISFIIRRFVYSPAAVATLLGEKQDTTP